MLLSELQLTIIFLLLLFDLCSINQLILSMKCHKLYLPRTQGDALKLLTHPNIFRLLTVLLYMTKKMVKSSHLNKLVPANIWYFCVKKNLK